MLAMPFALVNTRIMLVLTQSLFGFFCGLSFPAAHTLIAEHIPHSMRATAVSMIQSAGSVGNTVTNFVTPLAIPHVGWWIPFLVFFGCGLALVGVVWVFLPADEATLNVAVVKPDQVDSEVNSITELLTWIRSPLIQVLFLMIQHVVNGQLTGWFSRP